MKLLRPENLGTAEHFVSVTHRPLEALVSYDERRLAAPRAAGLPVAAPGLA
jgi:hypothetical protein